MSRILALDAGTTGVAAFVFDEQGSVVASADREFAQHFPQPGWVEHDAEEIWTTAEVVMREALENARLAPGDVRAIGITNQRETTVLWDAETGAPVARAIVWQDRRTAPFCESLREAGHEPLVRERTGLPLDPYFSATKIRWLLDHVPDARKQAERGRLRFGTVDAWLLAKLTGGRVHATDVTNASRTLLMDLGTGAWDADMLGLFGVPASLMPEIRASSGSFGETDARVFGAEVPLAGVAGDQQAALFGQACTRPGMAKNTYGTGAFLLAHAGRTRPKTERLVATAAAKVGDGPMEYALEGPVFVSGAAIQWLRDGLGILDDAAESERLAASVPDSGGVVFVPALAGLGAPWWDPHARGAILGLTRGATRAHLARAALEAIAHQVADVVEVAREEGLRLETLRVDGGGSANRLLLQMQADYADVPVERATVQETTARGAAFLAGVATDVWKGADDIGRLWSSDARVEPKMDTSSRAAKRAEWRRAVERAKGWVTEG